MIGFTTQGLVCWEAVSPRNNHRQSDRWGTVRLILLYTSVGWLDCNIRVTYTNPVRWNSVGNRWKCTDFLKLLMLSNLTPWRFFFSPLPLGVWQWNMGLSEDRGNFKLVCHRSSKLRFILFYDILWVHSIQMYTVYSIQYTIVHPLSKTQRTDLFLLSEASELRRIWGSREHSSTDVHHQHGWVARGIGLVPCYDLYLTI